MRVDDLLVALASLSILTIVAAIAVTQVREAFR